MENGYDRKTIPSLAVLGWGYFFKFGFSCHISLHTWTRDNVGYTIKGYENMMKMRVKPWKCALKIRGYSPHKLHNILIRLSVLHDMMSDYIGD